MHERVHEVFWLDAAPLRHCIHFRADDVCNLDPDLNRWEVAMSFAATRVRDVLVIALACVFGVGSLVLFVAYPLGALSIVSMDWSEGWLLCWDIGLSLIFFVQHSGMNRRRFRSWLGAAIPEPYHGAVYAIASGLALVSVVGLWQPVGTVAVTLNGAARLVAHVTALATFGVLVWSFVSILGHDPLGLRSIVARVRGADEPSCPFMVRGPYRWVRHPLYSSAIVLLWTSPDVTLDRLLFNVLWTAWIYVGARLEERDLVQDFGEAYRDYQRRIPMLVPWCGPIHPIRPNQIPFPGL